MRRCRLHFAIVGFLLASIVSVAMSLFQYKTTFTQVIVGIILMAVGAYLTLKLEKND